MATCPSCGRDQVQSSAFCAFCGAVLDRPASKPTSDAAAAAGPEPMRPVSRPAPAAVHDIGDVGTYIVRRLLALGVDVVFVGGLIAVALRAWLTVAAPNGALTVKSFFE